MTYGDRSHFVWICCEVIALLNYRINTLFIFMVFCVSADANYWQLFNFLHTKHTGAVVWVSFPWSHESGPLPHLSSSSLRMSGPIYQSSSLAHAQYLLEYSVSSCQKRRENPFLTPYRILRLCTGKVYFMKTKVQNFMVFRKFDSE